MAQALTNTSTGTTYKISFKKIARAAAAEVRVHKKLAIISYVLYGVALVLFLFNGYVYGISDMDTGKIKSVSFNPSGWGLFFAIIGVVVSFFTALNVFRDMNNQQLCDVSLALPIKASERFFSKLLSLFYLQVAPLILSTLGGNGITVLIGLARFNMLDDDTAKILFSIVLGCLAGSMFIMAIAVLCACCCGALAESAYFSLILMFCINVLPLCYVNSIIGQSGGFNFWHALGTDSIVDIEYWGFLYLVGDYDHMVQHCAVGCVISLAVMLLSGLIYKRRDARTIGTPIASRVFFEIMMFLGCATVFSISLMNMDSNVLWGVLIAAVAYIIINVIVCRAKINALSFLKWGGKYLATTAAFAVLLVITIKTGGFGCINDRPEAKYLEGAEFSIGYYDNGNFANYDSGWHDIYSDALTAEQADQVMTICKKHIIKGRSELGVLDIIFGGSRSTADVSVYAKSEKLYAVRPSPAYQFDYRYSAGKTKYYLDYGQHIDIPVSEARALEAELMELDFIYGKTM